MSKNRKPKTFYEIDRIENPSFMAAFCLANPAQLAEEPSLANEYISKATPLFEKGAKSTKVLGENIPAHR